VLYDHSVDAETTISGSEFQICAPATGKARPPMVESLKRGRPTSRRQVLVEQSARRPGRYVSDTSERSQVSRRGIVKNFVAQ